jgi:hypothetical protein
VVANNVTDLAAALTDPQIGGFSAAHCVVAPPRAGVAEVGDLLVQAASEAEDLLLFYYSGHGLLGTRSHELYLSVAATRLGRVPFTALPFAAVRDACLESRAASRVVILDSCFSGRAIGETLGADDEILGQVEVKGTARLRTETPEAATLDDLEDLARPISASRIPGPIFDSRMSGPISGPPGAYQPAVALWGPPASGKTTFLAALSLAVNRAGGDWTVTPANMRTEETLLNATAELANRGIFPNSTLRAEEYELILNGQAARTVLSRLRMRQPQERRISIPLALTDMPDEDMSSPQDELIDRLARSEAILYVFDPIREFEVGDAYERFSRACSRLGRIMSRHNASFGKLPHHLAVCINKFDEPRVYQTAKQFGITVTDPNDPYGFPRVRETDALALLDTLCKISANRSGSMLINAIQQYFHPARTRYFVTSAIGFYVDSASSRFNPDDPQNTLLTRSNGGAQRRLVRGPIHPINVMEPLVWLGEKLTERQ